ncbi:MAG: heat-inducible transcriptional repressor HrcA [Parvibaculales bacterium]
MKSFCLLLFLTLKEKRSNIKLWARRRSSLRLFGITELAELTVRARAIFGHIVEAYLETGAPIGSKNLADVLDEKLSPASIRSAMAELEAMGLLYAPHVSAGRLPTDSGLRLFIDGMMQLGDLSAQERAAMTPHLTGDESMEDMLKLALQGLSGLSACAGLVVAPLAERAVKHIEFVAISEEQILVILVDDANNVENRLIPRPLGLAPQKLIEAGNYLNHRLRGRTLGELRRDSEAESAKLEGALGQLTADLVCRGLIQNGAQDAAAGALSNSEMVTKSLIVHGRDHLLNDLAAMEDLQRVRHLFADLDRQKKLVALLLETETGNGVKIFIGAQTPLFSLSGSSLIISPCQDDSRSLVGVVGVIAPTRTDYARHVPMVDHTAKLVSTLLSAPKEA